ncbi:hypothetical protein DXX93_14745 [Thalassotalea euphylliae]|uniref:Uncharacterized protein n=1 Tax=Thalassotalea euphylliae TaxID=1655234 RepID=A0A3E0TTD9_9GAMM|nr:hypothetical protein [Thalassotalea euphylliae]REL27690.1 hypothetical protein DXX93_14745 [Thalassotalea euphylliae]
MTNSTMQKAEQLALKGNAQQVTQLIQDLANTDFLEVIDPPVQANTTVKATDNLTLLLRHLFSRKDIIGITDSVLWLAQQPTFSAEFEPGTFRHAALVEASGSAQEETAQLMAFLQAASNRYQQYAVKALAQLGSQAAVSLIWQLIYSEQSVLDAVEKEIFTKYYTGWLGVYRDRPPVLSLLVNHVYTTSARQLVITVLAEDLFRSRPDPKYHIPLAQLNQSVDNAVQLAVIIAKWFIFNAEDIGPAQHQQKIAQRIVDLVGAEDVELVAYDAVELRKWIQAVFESATAQTQDADRIALLAAGFNEILTSTDS